MTKAFELDLKKLKARAFDRAEWAKDVLRRYHAVAPNSDDATFQQLRALYHWMFVPPTLWPFNVQDVLADCLAALEKQKRLNARHYLLIDLLSEPPDENICAAVANHEHHIQKGIYENLVKTQAKYAQNELAIKSDPQPRRQWARIKSAFNVQAYRDHKGVIRRSMSVERNLRSSFSVNLRRRHEVFQAAFDAFGHNFEEVWIQLEMRRKRLECFGDFQYCRLRVENLERSVIQAINRIFVVPVLRDGRQQRL